MHLNIIPEPNTVPYYYKKPDETRAVFSAQKAKLNCWCAAISSASTPFTCGLVYQDGDITQQKYYISTYGA